MSKYTTQVRFICENAAGLTESKGYNDIENIITQAAPLVFNFEFPIFDEEYRLTFEKKILRHFYTREICAETVGLWKLWLSDKLNMIMPYYNKLYESATLEFNPFYDVDLTIDRQIENDGSTVGSATRSDTESRASMETSERDDAGNEQGTRTNSGNSNGSNSNTRTGDNWDLHSDTPQGGIVGVQNASVIDATLRTYTYLTDAVENRISEQNSGTNSEQHIDTNTHSMTNASSSDASRNISDSISRGSMTSNNVAVNNLEDYIQHVQGKRGGHTYSGMLMEYRKSLINIDAMVMEELNELFFGLWD